MKFGRRTLLSVCTLFLLCDMTMPSAEASTLSDKQQLMHRLQAQSSQTAANLANNKQTAQALKTKIQSYQTLLTQLHQELEINQQQRLMLQKKLEDLSAKIHKNQIELKHENEDLNQMLRALYESGQAPYLEVLCNATNWDDFLSRFESTEAITKTQKALVEKIVALHRTLAKQERAQETTIQNLQKKSRELESLQTVDQSLRLQQRTKLAQVHMRTRQDLARQMELNQKIHLTQSQIVQLEQQVHEAEAVLSTNVSAVTEPELRFQPIPPSALYDYVRAHDSTFTQADVQTIWNAAKAYDVNPALLIAITGQEQAFVPPGPDASQIRNNPFNVFYSWQVYNTNLADTANIAADTLRHKLSAPPQGGEDAILWINDPRNPWGIYATDSQWAYGVRKIFNDITQYVQARR